MGELPLIADILHYLVIACVFYLLYYSIQLWRQSDSSGNLPAPASERLPARSNRISRADPSYSDRPLASARVAQPPTLDLSIVIVADGHEPQMEVVLDSIIAYFQDRTTTFEVIVAITATDPAFRSAMQAYESQHGELRFLCFSETTILSKIMNYALAQIRGRAFFVFDLDDDIGIEALGLYEAKLASRVSESDSVLVLGKWRDEPENYSILRSTLNIYAEAAIARCERWCGVKQSATRHGRSFLMTRQAARLLTPIGSKFIVSNDLGYVVGAAILGVETKTVKLNRPDPRRYTLSSTKQLTRLIDVVVLLMYKGRRLWRRKAKSPQSPRTAMKYQ
jgi:hypothetical protein